MFLAYGVARNATGEAYGCSSSNHFCSFELSRTLLSDVAWAKSPLEQRRAGEASAAESIGEWIILGRTFKHLYLAACITACAAVPGYASAETFVTIGTGVQTGVYYVAGGSICKLVNRCTKEHEVKCTHTTGGSVKNINGIRAGDLDMGVAQSDWQYHGYNGTAPKQFPDGAFEALRAVFSVHPEPFTVVDRAYSGIKTFEDLVGKRVNIGNPGSGARGTMDVVMDKMGWTNDSFKLAAELKSSE
ncbi:MAG: TRAP transporter TAXI family solute receptor [Granulosicoccus sp.]|jgi:TRAP transporter TAXI family solute receptor